MNIILVIDELSLLNTTKSFEGILARLGIIYQYHYYLYYYHYHYIRRNC